MMKLFVYQTPESVPQSSLPDCAIAVDVLRATTTIANAINTSTKATTAIFVTTYASHHCYYNNYT